MRAHSVVIVLFEGVQSLDVTGPLEVFAGAGRASGQPPAYRVTTASPAAVRCAATADCGCCRTRT